MRPRTALLVLAALASSLSARAETIIRAVPQLDVKILDPYQNTNYGTRNHGWMIYETLFGWDSKYQARPQMVESWSTSDDGLIWTFHLRPGLRWHDGSPVTNDDVAASLDRFLHKDGFGLKMAPRLAGIDLIGTDSFAIRLTKPFPLLPQLLGKPSGFAAFILPARFARMKDGDPAFEAIGSGPFIFQKSQWQPGNYNVYLKNKAYTPRAEPADGFAGGHVVKVDRVEWRTIPDPNTAMNALIAGEVDWIERADFDSIATLEGEKAIVVAMSDTLGSQSYLRPNSLLPPFNNPKARQALLYLDDKPLYGQAAVGDPRFFIACPALFMCGGPLESNVGAITPNLDRARALMAEAGYKGETIVMMEPVNVPQFDAATQVTASQLRKIGVKVELQPVDYNAMLTRRVKRDPIDQGGWNLYHSGNFGIDVSSPLTNIYLNSSCDTAAPGWPCDSEIESLKDQFVEAATEADRKAIAEKLQLRSLETVPYVNVVQLKSFTAYRTTLHGIVPSPVQLYWNVEKAN